MEALKHSEWALGVVFFWFAIYNLQHPLNRTELTVNWILIVLIGSQLPDFFSLLLRKMKLSSKLVRKITHDYLFVILIWLLFPFDLNPEISFLAIGIAIHYGVDLFSGLEPLYIGGLLFGDRTEALYVTAAHRIAIGKRIEKWGSNYMINETEKPTPELAWFWIMQLLGTIFCGLGMIAYLL